MTTIDGPATLPRARDPRDGDGGRCRICGNAEANRPIVAREMMFGLREEFEYLECSACGCLQIASIPADPGRFYPENYYAHVAGTPRAGALRDALLSWRTAYQLGERSPLGWLVAHLKGEVPPYVRWARRAGIGRDAAVLDAGCGRGDLLLRMRSAGFTRLLGVDPYIDGDIDHGNGVRVLRRPLSGVEGEFDFVLMHHAFEHVPDPAGTLREVRRLLRPGRIALIVVPVADSYAWRAYGANWVQLDAPRHFFLHTRRSMRLLAESAGLELVDVAGESWDLQFWGSEQYMKDIPLRDPRSFAENPAASGFTADDLRRFTRAAGILNRRGDGDTAGFYLRRPEEAG